MMIQPGGHSEQDADRERDWDAFEAWAEVYGADLSRWPKARREKAQALIGHDPQRAEAILSVERSLDHLLAFAPDHPPSAALRAAVLAQATAKRPVVFIDLAWLRWCVRQPILSGAAALAVCAGLLVGTAMSGGVLAAARQDALAGAVQTDLASGAEPTFAGPT